MLIRFFYSYNGRVEKGALLSQYLLNSLKSKRGRLNISPNPYVKNQNPRASGSQDIVLTSFPIAITVKSKKGYNLVNISRNSLKSKSGHLNISWLVVSGLTAL